MPFNEQDTQAVAPCRSKHRGCALASRHAIGPWHRGCARAVPHNTESVNRVGLSFPHSLRSVVCMAVVQGCKEHRVATAVQLHHLWGRRGRGVQHTLSEHVIIRTCVRASASKSHSMHAHCVGMLTCQLQQTSAGICSLTTHSDHWCCWHLECYLHSCHGCCNYVAF